MSLFHGRDRRRTSLLAAEALFGAERAAALRHVESCSSCRAEWQALRETLLLLAADPVRAAEPPLASGALLLRVHARLDANERAAARGARAWGAAWRCALAASAGAAALLVPLRPAGRAPAALAPPAPAVAEIALPADSLRRLERNVARRQTARYLNEAEDVLVNVAAVLPRCARGRAPLDVGFEARRSRQLLARRALMVDLGERHVASAAPVLHDVERVLREVAALEDCVRPGDVEAIHRQLEERRLLMRITLVERELQG